MQTLTDQELIQRIKGRGDQDALIELTNRHKGICYSSSRKYVSLSGIFSGLSMREVLDGNLELVVYNAAMGYDKKFGTKFSTHLSNQVRFLWLNTINKNAKFVGKDDKEITFLIDSHQATNETFDWKDEIKQILDILSSVKDKRVKKIFELRYLSKGRKNMSWEEVGRRVGLTYQGAINIHHRYLKFLRKKISSKK